MDKSEWYRQQKALKDLLVLKEKEKQHIERDIEELGFTISCYDQKVDGYVPEEKV